MVRPPRVPTHPVPQLHQAVCCLRRPCMFTIMTLTSRSLLNRIVQSLRTVRFIVAEQTIRQQATSHSQWRRSVERPKHVVECTKWRLPQLGALAEELEGVKRCDSLTWLDHMLHCWRFGCMVWRFAAGCWFYTASLSGLDLILAFIALILVRSGHCSLIPLGV
jgi:hypothetical protein